MILGGERKILVSSFFLLSLSSPPPPSVIGSPPLNAHYRLSPHQSNVVLRPPPPRVPPPVPVLPEGAHLLRAIHSLSTAERTGLKAERPHIQERRRKICHEPGAAVAKYEEVEALAIFRVRAPPPANADVKDLNLTPAQPPSPTSRSTLTPEGKPG